MIFSCVSIVFLFFRWCFVYMKGVRSHAGPQIEMLETDEVNVMAGVTVYELRDFLLASEKTIPQIAVVGEATVAGIITLNTHVYICKISSPNLI